MHLTLKRTTFTTESTIGKLSIEGKFECYVLEDVVRKPGAGKVWGKTAIPAGTYPVTITYSNRFRRLMPLLSGVKGFEGIRIHSGNTAADTEGCLLVGTSQAKDFVGNSRAAYAVLYNKLKTSIDAGDGVTITIS
ncbi:DUF5675 family protein [Hymenobacter swuensis]|nr:DUF5675 family protein [Hymenobacter swuensis]